MIGDVQQAQGDLGAALTSYRASLAIAERLAKADPGNAGWQRDLSVSHIKIGDVQQAQGDLAAALTSYQASLAIGERLAKADRGNAGWQRNLALSYGRLARIEARQGSAKLSITRCEPEPVKWILSIKMALHKALVLFKLSSHAKMAPDSVDRINARSAR